MRTRLIGQNPAIVRIAAAITSGGNHIHILSPGGKGNPQTRKLRKPRTYAAGKRYLYGNVNADEMRRNCIVGL